MSGHAFILGGTGQIGQIVADAFISAGWNVTISHRGHRPTPSELVARGVKLVTFDRGNPGELFRVLGGGADVVVDTTAYDRDHGSQLLAIQGSVGSFVVISSASVYRDDLGRTLDEAIDIGFPELPDPIPETHPTVEPGPATYSTRKVALERHLLSGATIPVTILRPCAIHGLYSRHPREWWVVKRILDGRPLIPLAYGGASRFHTSTAANIAALVLAAVKTPGSRVLNIADPDRPTVIEITQAIARHLNYRGRVVQLEDTRYPPVLGRTPWSVPRPFTVDCSAALGLGYCPATTYSEAVGATCDWLAGEAAEGDWKLRYPLLASYPRDLFDYAAEDTLLNTVSARSRLA